MTPTPVDVPPDVSSELDGFEPCPLCKQYSHSIGGGQVTEAFNHFQSMYSHRGDGIPTQDCFDAKTKDAAQVLMARIAALEAVVEEVFGIACDYALDERTARNEIAKRARTLLDKIGSC